MQVLCNYRLPQQVDAKTVREVATKYLWDRCPAVVAIGKYNYHSFADPTSVTMLLLGPIEQLPDYTRIRGNMSWRRI